MIAGPPSGKPRTFYWFCIIWATVLGFGMVWPLMPKSDTPDLFRPFFWFLALVSVFLLKTFLASLLSWWRHPVIFDAGDGTPPRRLRSTRTAFALTLWLAFGLTGTIFTVAALPFSPTARLLAGLRGRKIELPRRNIQPEDRTLAEIYLQPIEPLTREAAAALSAELRAETGLHIAALPEQKFDLTLHPTRKQVAAGKIFPQLNQLGMRTQLPPPPLPHSPLMIALIEEDMYSENLPWNYTFGLGFSKTLGVVSAGHLKLELPLDDAAAQRLYFVRLKKLALRLIAQLVFEEPHGTDRRSLTGPVFRSVSDLDFCEDHLRFSPQERVMGMRRPGMR